MSKFSTGIIVALLAVWLLREGCNCYSLKQKDKALSECITQLHKPAIVIHDTTRIQDTISGSIPIQISDGPIPPPVIEIREVPVDNYDTAYYNYLIRVKDDYFSKYLFADSVQTPYGVIKTLDSVHRNRITWNQMSYDLYISSTTEIKRDTIVQKINRGRLFLGPIVQGNRADVFRAGGLGLSYTSKGSKQYDAAVLYDQVLKRTFYQGSVRLELKFKR